MNFKNESLFKDRKTEVKNELAIRYPLMLKNVAINQVIDLFAPGCSAPFRRYSYMHLTAWNLKHTGLICQEGPC